MDSFQFNGGQITARQLSKQVTAYSEGALQTALESGCQTVPAVMAYLATRDALRVTRQRVGSQLGKTRSEWRETMR